MKRLKCKRCMTTILHKNIFYPYISQEKIMKKYIQIYELDEKTMILQDIFIFSTENDHEYVCTKKYHISLYNYGIE